MTDYDNFSEFLGLIDRHLREGLPGHLNAAGLSGAASMQVDLALSQGRAEDAAKWRKIEKMFWRLSE